VFGLKAQTLVESIASIVGNEVFICLILKILFLISEEAGTGLPTDQLRCNVFEEMLISKLFLDQARIDSIIVSDNAVEGELNMRMNDAIQEAGSEEGTGRLFQKSMLEIRRDIRKTLIEQEVVREVQNKIAQNVSVTPAALKRFFASHPKDSLPVFLRSMN
jgi:peptidyl-prolyl cis-trans isomerase SurA